MNERTHTIEKIKGKLDFLLSNKPVKKVILFGSYAKNRATKISDIDLVIDSDSKLRGFEFLKLTCKFQKDFDCFEQCEIKLES